MIRNSAEKRCSTKLHLMNEDEKWLFSTEIKICFVMVEGQAICAAEFSQNCHDVLLLLGHEFVLAVMITEITEAP